MHALQSLFSVFGISEHQRLPQLSPQPHSEQKLPKEMVAQVFRKADLKTLVAIRYVNNELYEWASVYIKQFVYDVIAINSQKWNGFGQLHFGKDIVTEDPDLERDSLPNNIGERLISRCPVFKKRAKFQTHILVRRLESIDEKPFNLRYLGELVKKYFPNNPNGYAFIEPGLDVNKTIDDDKRWMLLLVHPPKNGVFCADTGNYEHKIKSNYKSKNVVKEILASYHKPEPLEMAACLLGHYFDSGKRLFDKKNYACCEYEGNNADTELIVGNFTSQGLHIKRYVYHVDHECGRHNTVGIMRF